MDCQWGKELNLLVCLVVYTSSYFSSIMLESPTTRHLVDHTSHKLAYLAFDLGIRPRVCQLTIPVVLKHSLYHITIDLNLSPPIIIRRYVLINYPFKLNKRIALKLLPSHPLQT